MTQTTEKMHPGIGSLTVRVAVEPREPPADQLVGVEPVTTSGIVDGTLFEPREGRDAPLDLARPRDPVREPGRPREGPEHEPPDRAAAHDGSPGSPWGTNWEQPAPTNLPTLADVPNGHDRLR